MGNILTIIFLLTFAILTSRMAYEKNRNVFVWFFVGGWFHVVAFIVMLCLKPKIKDGEIAVINKNSHVAIYAIIAVMMTLGVICFNILIERNRSIIGEWECDEISLNLSEKILDSTSAENWFWLSQNKRPDELDCYSNIYFYKDGNYKYVLILKGKRKEISGSYEKIGEVPEMNRVNYAIYDQNGNEIDSFVVHDKKSDIIYDVNILLSDASLIYKRK